MTYLRRHNAPASRAKRLASVALAVVIVLAGAIEWRIPRLFPSIASSVAAPFWRTRFALENGALEDPQALLAENEDLKQQIASLKTVTSSSSLAILEQQNADLLALLGRATTTKSAYKAAAVLARPPFAGSGRLIVDLGTDEGAASGTPVYAPGPILIGRVSESFGESSFVDLLSSPGQSYQVLIGPGGIPATAKGIGGGQYTAQVPHDSTVAPGDIVSDSTLHDKAFGVVISVNTDPSDPFDSVVFAPPVDIYDIRWVLLGIGQDINKP
ncbi:MAG: rod shape-determining protein MreC [Patescibacteria group bacterium]|nr:rod shape-determining protein MreC [Patescibacteria group bacterium]